MALYKMSSPEDECILYAIQPECLCLNYYSIRSWTLGKCS